MNPEEVIKNQMLALLASEPHRALDLLASVEGAIRDSIKPRIELIEDEDYCTQIHFDGEVYEIDCLIIVDTSQRWVELGGNEIDQDKRQISPWYDETAEYEGLGYFLSTPKGMIPVDLPEGWMEA